MPRHYTLKRRRRLTNAETEYLVRKFMQNERPTTAERDRFAQELRLDKRTIQVWFQNRRAKMKKDEQLARDYALDDDDDDDDDVEGDDNNEDGEDGMRTEDEKGRKYDETATTESTRYPITNTNTDTQRESTESSQLRQLLGKPTNGVDSPQMLGVDWLLQGFQSSAPLTKHTARDYTVSTTEVLAEAPPSHEFIFDPDAFAAVHWDDPFMAELSTLALSSSSSSLSSLSSGLDLDDQFSIPTLILMTAPEDTGRLIQKANDQATLLLELLNLGDRPSSFQELKDNEVLQQVYKTCQDYSADLVERIAEDDEEIEDTTTATASSTTYGYSILESHSTSSPSSSSSSRPHTDTLTAKEAQIAALLAAIERLQLAFKQYDELRDYLHAKELQSVEDYYAAEMSTSPSVIAHSSSSATRISSTTTHSTSIEEKDEEEEDEEEDDEDLILASQRSRQPIEYRLDPRPDYRANQRRLKNGKASAELHEARIERAREKQRLNPNEPSGASLEIDEVKADETNDKNDAEMVEIEQVDLVAGHNQSDEGSKDDEVGYLSDSSWQEVPEEGLELGVVSKEVESGTSSIIIV
ncbi:hypothetical protein BGW42_003336 [Actinomortierella wolfii]|nr:hypothetical protein BGW42_003336 [Actinomortierella wolfii]